MNRRTFLANSTAAAAGALTLTACQTSQPARRPKVLLRSSWQTVNIGDIAHTPGVLNLLEKHIPEADVTLWPSKVDNGVEEMLRARFPKLKIVKGSDDLKRAFAENDFLLHGSGPSLVAEKDVVRWKKETGKPYGIYCITFSTQGSTATQPAPEGVVANSVEVMSGARFVFFRDSVSLELAKSRGCKSPIMEFGPDGAFATDLRDDAKAEAFLKANGLEAGKFLCCIPRLRYTPYWVIHKERAFDPVKHQLNEKMKEHDHAQLRAGIIEVVRQTNLKVLVCPEDQTQMAIGKELLYDPLPAELKQRVVWRPDYWLTGEALSTYVRSAGLFGNEMHSPIMCIGNGIPAIVCRWAEQTSKGIMWRDIGLGNWLFDLDNEAEVARVVPTIMEIARQPKEAKAEAARARAYVEKRQRETMGVLRRELGLRG
jgi:polysaccharide pyruvyl transferase WcaK-like protein